MVGSLNDWQKERQFQSLNDKKEERGVKVIRGGVEQIVDIHQVVVGDVALVEPGEIIPCDGVFLSGHNVKCDESGATGESDAIRKVSYEECKAMQRKGHESAHTDCFMISGSKVQEGYGSYVVIAVGTKSFNGRIMMGKPFNTHICAYTDAYTDSSARRHREHALTAQVERPSGAHRKAGKRSWVDPVFCPHDPILRPAGNEQS